MIPGFGAGLVIPDLWQQEAVRALQQGKDVVVQAPTGSGKTYRDSNLGARPPAQGRPRPAVMLALANAILELLYPDLKTQAVFTVPTRALANGQRYRAEI
jgi:ATP-dependent helicase YprA (DUF1998 family)